MKNQNPYIWASLGAAFAMLVCACNKSDSGSAASTASTTTSAVSAPAATTAAATTAAAAGPLTISATCTTKAGARVLGCTEYYGKLPDGAAESCKKDDGTFTTGTTPCSTENAIGKCAHAGTTAASQTEVSYKTSVGDAKGSCEALGNKWTALGGK